MKVILKKEHVKLGMPGEFVNVKDGFAQNYLIPNGIAVQATEGNVRAAAEIQKQRANKTKKESEQSQQLASELEKVQLTIKVKSGEDEKIFGSVTSQTIADALSEKGYSVDKKFIVIDEPIKHLGIFTVNIRFNKDAGAAVKVWVVKE